MDRRKFVLVPAAAALTATAFAGRKFWRTTTTSTTTSSTATTTTTAAATSTTTTTAPTTTSYTEPVTQTTVAPANGTAYPFGSRPAAYVTGIRPNVSNADMDAQLRRHYDAWKAARVVDASSIVAGGKAIKFSNASFLTVSEGMGYGMLLAVLFAGHDPNARSLFDGLLAVVRTRYAYSVAQYDPAAGRYLMDWRLYPDGKSAGEGWNAMDGDLDMAMALLMADKQWGSNTGTWNYLQEAKNTIAALKSWNFAVDGTTKGLSKGHVSRTSDYMIGHFRAFQAATGDAFWQKAIDRAAYLTELMQNNFSGVGLMPDFIINTDTNPIPSPGMFGDFNYDENKYWWNACRNPWRYASDVLLSNDARWKAINNRLIDFFNAKFIAAGNSISAIECGYNLNGTVAGGGDSAAFIAPIMLGGCVDPKYQALVNAGWAWCRANMVTGYYDGEIELLSMVVASGNWWSPVKSTYTAAATTTNSTSTTAQPIDRVLQMAPAAATTAGASFMALATSRQAFSNTYKFKAEVCTRKQLRAGGDASDVAWTVWNLVDPRHFYYFALKPTGWEFGKVYAGVRKVISTGVNMSAAIGQKYLIEVQVFGEWADVYVNGQYCTYLQDNGYQGSPQLFGGKVGLCAMNADCVWNNVTLPFADTFDAEPVRALASGQDLANWHIDTLGSGSGAIIGA